MTKMNNINDEYPNFTEVVTWPEIQDYMTKDGFIDNTALINSEHGIEIYGSSAYRMNPDWKSKVDSGVIKDYNDPIDFSDWEYNYEDSELNIDYGFPYNEND